MYPYFVKMHFNKQKYYRDALLKDKDSSENQI